MKTPTTEKRQGKSSKKSRKRDSPPLKKSKKGASSPLRSSSGGSSPKKNQSNRVKKKVSSSPKKSMSPTSLGSASPSSSITSLSIGSDIAEQDFGGVHHHTFQSSPLNKAGGARRNSFMHRLEHSYSSDQGPSGEDKDDRDLREYLDSNTAPLDEQSRARWQSPLSVSPSVKHNVGRETLDNKRTHSITFHPESMNPNYTDEIERNEERVKALRSAIVAESSNVSPSRSRKKRLRDSMTIDLDVIPPLPTPTLYSDHEVQISTVKPAQGTLRKDQDNQAAQQQNGTFGRRYSMVELQKATSELQSRFGIPLNVSLIAQKLQEGTWKKMQHVNHTPIPGAKRRHSDSVLSLHKSKKKKHSSHSKNPKRNSMIVLDSRRGGVDLLEAPPVKKSSASPKKRRTQKLKEVKRKKAS